MSVIRRRLRRSDPDALFASIVVFYDAHGGKPMTRAQIENAHDGAVALSTIYAYFAGLLLQKGWSVEQIAAKLDHPFVLTLANHKGRPALVLQFTDGSGRLTGIKR